jgi:hypothetical protein
MKRTLILINTLFAFAPVAWGAAPTPQASTRPSTSATPALTAPTSATPVSNDSMIMIDPAKLKAARAALHPAAPSKRWSVFVSAGLNGLGNSHYVVTGANSTVNASDTTAPGATVGGGFSYLINPIFQLGGELEYSAYHYSSGSASDSDVLVMFVPRAQTKSAKRTLWAGLGTGLAITSIANSPGNMALGSGAPTSSSSPMGIVISPEVGADYDLGRSSFIGAQASYVLTTGSLGEQGTGTVPTSENYIRRWASLALRYGTRF